MERRTLLAAGAALATAGTTRVFAATGSMSGMDMGTSMKDCIDLCTASHRTCLDTSASLTQRADTPSLRRLTLLLSDCAELCSTTANSMSRGSPLHPMICRACAEACEFCAKECQRQGTDELKSCADTCLKCAAGCQKMAAMSA
jgi:hypothetical protein